jgi:hypothetical protein
VNTPPDAHGSLTTGRAQEEKYYAVHHYSDAEA